MGLTYFYKNGVKSYENESILYYKLNGNNLSFYYLSAKDGNSEKTFTIPLNSQQKNIQIIKPLKDGIFILSKKDFFLYNHAGKLLSTGSLPSEKSGKILYSQIDDKNNFYFFFSNWNFERHSIYQATGTKTKPSFQQYSQNYSAESSIQNSRISQKNKSSNYSRIIQKEAAGTSNTFSFYSITEDAETIKELMKKGL